MMAAAVRRLRSQAAQRCLSHQALSLLHARTPAHDEPNFASARFSLGDLGISMQEQCTGYLRTVNTSGCSCPPTRRPDQSFMRLGILASCSKNSFRFCLSEDVNINFTTHLHRAVILNRSICSGAASAQQQEGLNAVGRELETGKEDIRKVDETQATEITGEDERRTVREFVEEEGTLTAASRRGAESSEEPQGGAQANEVVAMEALKTGSVSKRRDLAILFTCTICNTRSGKTMSRATYETGVVIVRCPNCSNLHLIADHKGWFGEPGSVETFLAQKGVEIRKGTEETYEFGLDDLAGWSHNHKSD